MKIYNNKIKDNDKVCFILCSLEEEGALVSWAKKEGFSFPIVTNDKLKRSGLEKFKGRGVPFYALVDKEGNIISQGNSPPFDKAGL